jgi:hypothetical protein
MDLLEYHMARYMNNKQLDVQGHSHAVDFKRM